MTIKQRIDSDLKIALLAGEKDRATTLRGLKSAILNAEIANNMREQGLSEEDLIPILNKEVKKRHESAEMYERGGSKERADKEIEEAALIGAYLPAQLADDELAEIVDAAVAETKPIGMQDMGKVIALVKEKVSGQADGSRIAAAVKERIAKV